MNDRLKNLEAMVNESREHATECVEAMQDNPFCHTDCSCHPSDGDGLGWAIFLEANYQAVMERVREYIAADEEIGDDALATILATDGYASRAHFILTNSVDAMAMTHTALSAISAHLLSLVAHLCEKHDEPYGRTAKMIQDLTFILDAEATRFAGAEDSLVRRFQTILIQSFGSTCAAEKFSLELDERDAKRKRAREQLNVVSVRN